MDRLLLTFLDLVLFVTIGYGCTLFIDNKGWAVGVAMAVYSVVNNIIRDIQKRS